MKPKPSSSIESAIRSGRLLEVDAELLEHVGRACRRARGPVAVLRHRRAGGRGDERGRRRDVERVRAVAAGADDVDDRRALRRDGDDVLAHRLGEARDLVGRLALRPQRDEEAGDLGRRRLAVHDRAHQLVRVLAREVVPVEQQLDRGADDHPRKFLAIAGPSGVSTLSGWNCTPSIGSSRWRTPITSPSGVCEVTVELGGHLGRGERVVAADLDLGRKARVDAEAVVRDRARLAVQERLRLADRAAEGLDDRLVPEADAERRHRRAERADQLDRDAGALGPAGAGGDDEPVEAARAAPRRP